MEVPPLTLTVLQLSPPSCIPSHQLAPPLTPVPSHPIDYPPLPPNFTISPSPHYPAPFGTMSLGETFNTHVRLSNTSTQPVRGVKMMIEVQGPNGRYRLGEIVHDNGQDDETPGEGGEQPKGEPEMEVGGGVDMDVGGEMKDVGVNLLICSVAWETEGGRKTFQRFFKFNVTPPLAIKTRIHSPTSPSTLLDPHRRSDIHLEILVQNTSLAGLAFDKVVLEPVKGLLCRPTTSEEYKDKPLAEDSTVVSTLFPDDTRQYLFTLSPDPDYDPSSPSPNLKEGEDDKGDDGVKAKSAAMTSRSVFPPRYVPGTILPLGRLDVAWFSAPYRSPGRLQTSTLNRRVNVPATLTRPVLASRTSTLPPTPGQGPLSTPRAPSQQVDSKGWLGGGGWEYDLVLLNIEREVEIETRFEVLVRVAARTTDPVSEGDETNLPKPRLALQYLSHPTQSGSGSGDGGKTKSLTAGGGPTANPTMMLSTPSRTSTPLSPSGRPFSPPGAAGPSRPMTPVSSQLRQATTSSIGRPSTPLPLRNNLSNPTITLPSSTTSSLSFPPPPYLQSAHIPRGQVTYIGNSLINLPGKECTKVTENMGTTYIESTDIIPQRWEVVHELKLGFIALDEGMCDLGGLRLLELDDEVRGSGSVVQEWETLGDVWVTA